MALKGNLLFNGDFETGTTEGWNLNPEGFSNDFDLLIETVEVLGGNYGGNLISSIPYAMGWICYEHLANFEEYDAYLLVFPTKIEKGTYLYQALFGYDDKEQFRGILYLGYNNTIGEWKRGQAILRGFGDITHFKVGAYLAGASDGGQIYIDEVKLIPLKRVTSQTLAENIDIANLTTSKVVYPPLACMGRCILESTVRVKYVSGTDPQLKVTVYTGLVTQELTNISFSHTPFTDIGVERKVVERSEIGWILIDYDVSGTDPSFGLYHHLRIIPIG